MSLSASSAIAGPTPSTIACLPNTAPTLNNVTGISGQVCQINYPPSFMDISSCCKEGVKVSVQDNCTQYCEASPDQAADFRECIVDKLDQDPVVAIAAPCHLVYPPSASPSSSTPGPSGTPSLSATTSSDLPESTGGGSSLGQYAIGLAAVAATVAFGFSSLA